jgi:GT2 family glycosyltransferase
MAPQSKPSPQPLLDEHHPFRASVVIVSYNAQQKLMACLQSVLRSLPEGAELIVVDNASSEGNADAVAAAFPEIHLICAERNLGFAGGCNLGSRHARGQSLVFLNPDTLVEPGWLEALIAPFEGNDRIGLVTARILLMAEPDRINTCGNDVHLTGLTLCRGMGRARDSYPAVEEVGAVSGAAFAIRRALFEKLGGLDEEMVLYVEDTDLSWRARLAGYATVYTPHSIVLHDYELRITRLKVFWQERNRYLMLLKSLRWPTLLALLPAFFAAELVTWGFVLLKDRGSIANKLHAYGWILANWRTVMRKRRETQELRAVPDRRLIQSTGFALDFDQTASGAVARFARYLFNPLFFVLRAVCLAVVWW